jgi:hypothetical protein
MTSNYDIIVQYVNEMIGDAEAIRTSFINQIEAFCQDNDCPDVRISNVSITYRESQDPWVSMNAVVSVAGLPEKQQVPILRRLEQAWDPPYDYRVPSTTPKGCNRDATYHPTSKYNERRLQLEQSIVIRQ